MTFAILQVVREFSLDGGVETVAYELQRAWEIAGVNSTVLASLVPDGGKGPPSTEAVRRVVPWLSRVGARGRLRYLGRLIVVPWFTIVATRALRQHRDAVVLSHGDTLAGDVLVIHAVNKASLVAKQRTGNYRWMLNPMHAWVGWRDRRMIGGLRFRRYVAVSRRVAEELATHYAVPAERIAIIPNGINLGRFAAPPDARAAIRAEFSIPDAAPLLLFVGHEFERKGLSFVIAAMAMLPNDVRLLVVGADDPAPYQKLAVTAGVAGRVAFAGPRRDLPAIYHASDAFVFPTAYESFSLVCMEALACGVPVFATRAGGIEDYLEDGVNGAGITRDPADIADKLQMFLDSPDLRSRLRDGARATAQRFDWASVASMYHDLLLQVDRERRGAVTDRS